MAIGTPTLRDASGAIATSVTSASFTPAANSILFCWAGNDGSGSPSTTPVISDSLGGSWTQIGSTVTLSDLAGALFYQSIGGSPSAMTVTSTCSDGERVCINVFDVTGAGTDFSNTASGTNASGDPSFSISSPAGTSAVFGFAFALGGNNFTPPSGYTELTDTSPGATTRRTTTVYDLSSSGTTLTWSSTNGNCVAFAVEVKEPSAGSATLAADGGSYAVTGAAATTKLGRRLDAAGGSYAVTGAAATLRKGSLVGAAGGTYSITGATANFIRARTVAANSASYTINGAAATLNKGRSVVANGASYAIGGTAAGLLNKQILAANGGSYSISGAPAGVLRGSRVLANGGAYAIGGTAAGFLKGRGLVANSGIYSINGGAANFLRARRVAANGGSYSITGTEAGLSYSGAGPGGSATTWQQLIRRRRT